MNGQYTVVVKIIGLLCLTVLLVLNIVPVVPQPVNMKTTTMVSYNPEQGSIYHSPLSTTTLLGLAKAESNDSGFHLATAFSMVNNNSTGGNNANSGMSTVRQNSLRFINDNSYFPQSETSIAIDPLNPNHILGGFNDGKFFFCTLLPNDCANSISTSLSGFTLSVDGGKSILKTGDIPNIIVNSTGIRSGNSGVEIDSWGDPSVVPSIDGNFYYASIAINPLSPRFGNGVMIAKSNSNLFNNTVSCQSSIDSSTVNSCWTTTKFVYGSVRFPFPSFSIEDKDRIAVDRNPSSPYYGSVYIGWDHFYPLGYSGSWLARCDMDLVSCTMLSGNGPQDLSGAGPFATWTTPLVGIDGTVYVAWCNMGTFNSYGPVSCHIRSSPAGGLNFGPTYDIVSYMGNGTILPNDTVVLGWSSEQFRTAPGLLSIAIDTSGKSNNLYFTTQVCTTGHYNAFSPLVAPVGIDNPGSCGLSSVIFLSSSNNGSSWSSPVIISKPAVNDQSYVTVDTVTGTVYVTYYSSLFDTFNHRIDVVSMISNNNGGSFRQNRITNVSNEPDSDPNMSVYLSSNGGAWIVPQYGDYFETTAFNGTFYVLYTANYTVESGTFQTDPYLAIVK